MTPKKILQVIEIYRKLFETAGIEKIDYPHDKLLKNKVLGLSHCHGMLDKMVTFVNEGRLDKAYRWLGFVQCAVWFGRFCTIGDFMEHNRPDDPANKEGENTHGACQY
jgi:hypothetical protein